MKKTLQKHGHYLVGEHSAVKTCLWLNKAIRNEGFCYKHHFYGIESHQCVQMTPSISCNQRCLYCWRPVEINAPEVEVWDPPEFIAGECLDAQIKLISGYGGSPDTTDMRRLEEANNPRHAAISLIGEPTLYPYLPELIEEFHGRDMTTFLVTNGTNPEMLKKVRPTQLYLSLSAPDRETYLRVCNPKTDMWDRISDSLDVMQSHDGRTVIRVTLVKGVNDINPKGYAALIKRASPDFVEVKAYMHLGFSRRRLERNAMPSHKEIKEFGEKVAEHLDYKIAHEVPLSRVVLLTEDGEMDKLF